MYASELPPFLPPTITPLDKCVPHTACPFGPNGTDIIKKRLGLGGRGGVTRHLSFCLRRPPVSLLPGRSELLEVVLLVFGGVTRTCHAHFGLCGIVTNMLRLAKTCSPQFLHTFETSKRFSLSETWRTNLTSHSDPPQSVLSKMF